MASWENPSRQFTRKLRIAPLFFPAAPLPFNLESGVAQSWANCPTCQRRKWLSMRCSNGESANGFVIDLGSGDGRIIITAKTLKAKGLGVDIDTSWSRSVIKTPRARRRGSCRVRERDMFKTDISRKRAHALRSPEFMQRSSKVRSEFKGGSRVVAHDYHMGDWIPIA
jgi:hypothetical protein